MESFNSYIINKDNLLFNLNKILSNLPKTCKLCAVLKANAYGLGIENIVPIIMGKVDYYAVACVFEAERIREFDNSTPILILAPVPFECYEWCEKNNIELAISNLEQVKYIIKNYSGILNVHLVLNTGMNRYGFKTLRQLKQALIYIKNSNHIVVSGVFTHFATKDDNINFINSQFDKFTYLIDNCGLKNVIRHCASSYQSTFSKSFQLDMVRVGMFMCGMNRNASKFGFKPVLQIKSKLVAIQDVKKNESVGYSRLFVADRNMRVGVVALGYADGFDKRLGGNFKVLINDTFCNVIGKICMDCFFIDITNVKNTQIGTCVTILGKDYCKSISLFDYANVIGTCEYESLLKFRNNRFNIIIE